MKPTFANYLALCLCLLFNPLPSFSQEWNLLTPLHLEADFTDLESVGNNTFYLFDNFRDEVLKSTDGGETWFRHKEIVGFTNDAHMFDENNGVISVSNRIYKTSDGFENLTQVSPLNTLTNTKEFLFIGNNIGYSRGSSGKLFKTIDGGDTWVDTSPPTSPSFNGMHFINSQVGFVVGYNLLLKTSDGGENWRSLSNENANYLDVHFFDELNGLVVLRDSIQITQDGGVTWQQTNDVGGYKIYIHDGNLSVLTSGFQFDLMESSDQGLTWTPKTIYTGYRDIYTMVSVGNKIIAVGEGIIYKSFDNGDSFSEIHRGIYTGDLKSISFANKSNGVVAGERVLITSTGGQTWSQSPVTGEFNDVHILPNGSGIACRNDGHYALTDDFGSTWQSRPSVGPIFGSTCWINAEDKLNIGGGNGINTYSGLYHSENGGINWEKSDLGKIVDIHYPTESIGYALSEYGPVYKTLDGGNTWNEIATVNYNSRIIHFFSAEIGFTSSLQSVRKTTDGGVTWHQSPGIGGVIALHFYDEMLGYGVTSKGSVLRTEDGGQSWNYIVSEPFVNNILVDASFTNGTIFTVGDDDIYSLEIPPYTAKAYSTENMSACEGSHNTAVATFDLTLAENDLIRNQTDMTVSYHKSQEDVNNDLNPIANETSYSNIANPETIYVRVEKLDGSSYDTISFELVVHGSPDTSGSITDYENMDENNDGVETFDLTSKWNEILNGQDANVFEVSYFTSQTEAENNTNAITNQDSFTNTVNPQTIYVGLLNTNTNCYSRGNQSFELRALPNEPPLDVNAIIIAEIVCHSDNSAAIQADVIGGIPQYYYELLDGTTTTTIVPLQSSNLFENLGSGDYIIRVQDADGQEALSNSISVLEPPILMTQTTTTNISCMGANDGSIEITAIGGVAPYEFSLDGLAYSNASRLTHLAAGFYSIYTKDANGCLTTQDVVLTRPSDTDLDNDGLGDACDDDVDGDGVMNELDECAETPLGTEINVKGCEQFTLPGNNFSVQTTSETCASSNNGSILVTALENLDYTATLKYDAILMDMSFGTSVAFQNLKAGAYEICITVAGQPHFERCYILRVAQPEPLEIDGKVDNSGKSITFKMKGGDNYTIDINGTIYQTTAEEITLPLSKVENIVSVRTDKDCQGIYEEIFLMDISDISVFPNPVVGSEVSVLLPNMINENVQLALYTSDGRLVVKESLKHNSGLIKLNTSGLTSGVYNLKIETGNKTHSRKIIIK